MNRTIYLITEKEIWEDGEGESHYHLSDSDETWFGKHSKTTSQPVEAKDVTIDMIVSACESELENANYHDMTNMPSWFVMHMRKHLSDSQVKDILWSMIQDKGFLWID